MDKEIALILKKYFTIFILTFLLVSAFFLLFFDIAVLYIKGMPKTTYTFLTIVIYFFYIIVFILIIKLLLKEKKKNLS